MARVDDRKKLGVGRFAYPRLITIDPVRVPLSINGTILLSTMHVLPRGVSSRFFRLDVLGRSSIRRATSDVQQRERYSSSKFSLLSFLCICVYIRAYTWVHVHLTFFFLHESEKSDRASFSANESRANFYLAIKISRTNDLTELKSSEFRPSETVARVLRIHLLEK